MTEGTLVMKSETTDSGTEVAITFGEYEKVVGAVASIRATGNIVALKVTIGTNIVTVWPASTVGSAGKYDVVADCI